ncbi:hypothetical protein JCM19235_3298 [Vibrio maritimus]|uniref:Uncharacterized protein n=1 Tax=Vibrio maritimus TaxID=990268 RepID=A0A090SU13_9VIBR|nr:hypothetical protein JCM19235_3298 [Vibrio maritimus]
MLSTLKRQSGYANQQPKGNYGLKHTLVSDTEDKLFSRLT